MTAAVATEAACRCAACTAGLAPFTLDHFREWALHHELDNDEPWTLEQFEERFAADVFAGIPICWLVVPEGQGKALALDTPIPTPDGWTEMGALEVGDEVFDDQGHVCRVARVTETMHGHDCFRVVFSDGTSVVADADHLWRVRDVFRDHRCKTLDVTITTREVAAKNRVDRPNGMRCHRYSVPPAHPLDTPELLLPIEPYVLGAWLGDGSTADGRITFGEDFIRNEIGRRGYVVGPNNAAEEKAETRTVYGLKTALRDVGVLGNKHIPAAYLRASRLQRLNLLQGLMDADGTVSARGGQCTLTTIKRRLATDILELVRSLGLKVTVRERRAKIYDRDCGPAWVISFFAYDDLPVFQMPRKYARQTPRPKQRSISETRRIKDVIPVPSVPVRCIEVDSESHLYLAGEGMVATHNTTFVAGLSLYVIEHMPSAYIPVAASARDQAEWIYRQAEGLVFRTGRTDEFKCLEGYRRIRFDAQGSRIQVFAADDRSGDGIIPGGICVLDELHRHRDLALYETWKGKLRKRGAQLVVISTAGEVGGEFEQERERLRKGATETERDGCFVRALSSHEGKPLSVLHEYALPEGSNIDDLDLVKQANPASYVTIESLREKRAMVKNDQHWSRFTCNLASRASNAAVTEIEWHLARSEETIPADETVWLGLDLGWKFDTTALVPLWIRDPGFRLFGPATILTPPRDGSNMDPRLVEEALEELHHRNPFEVVVMDMTKGEQLASWIEDTFGCEVVDRNQHIPMQALDYQKFMEALREGWLHHSGDPGLTRHVLNATSRMLPQGDIVFSRPSESRHGRKTVQETREIDALVAAAMVHSTAAATLGVSDVEPLLAWG